MTNKQLNVCHCGYALLSPQVVNKIMAPNNKMVHIAVFIPDNPI